MANTLVYSTPSKAQGIQILYLYQMQYLYAQMAHKAKVAAFISLLAQSPRGG